MASFLFTTFKRDIMKGQIDLDAGDQWCMLLLSTFSTVATASSHDFRNDITAFEVTAGGTTGYTVGGVTLGTAGVQTVSADLTNNLGYWLTSVNASWATAYITARYAVVYKSTAAATTDSLVCCYDFGQDYTASNGTFTVQWSTAGLIKLS